MDMDRKIAKIRALSDEVNEFHPFLQEFFSKLSIVKNVGYTHGNREFGSDFVLTIEDTTFMQEDYVGVVVKVGDIKQSDVLVIKKQIEESFAMPKAIQNGKKRIRINSVWFISNGVITQNAKDLIHESIKQESIKILDCNDIVKLVDRNYSEYWNNMTINVSKHITKVRTQVENEDQRYTLLPNLSHEFYIEPHIVRIHNDEYVDQKAKKQTREKINIKDAIEKSKFILLEGGMGFGKSKLIRQLVKYYTDIIVYEEKRILVFQYKYSDLFSEGNFLPSKLMEISDLSVEEIEQHTKSIFMIDGFDEVEEDIQTKHTNIKALEDFVNSKDKMSILLATRDLREYVSSKNLYIMRCRIQSLTLKQILLFLEKLCNKLNLTHRIIEDLKKSTLFKELPMSPIAAILLARLLEENSKDLPSNLPQLYSMYLESVLGKWDIDKGIGTISEYEVVEAVLYKISQWFIDNNHDCISISDYKTIISGYLSSRNIMLELQRIDYIITERSGLLTKDNSVGIIYYSHRSFIEFMYAKSKSINNDLPITDKVFNLSWQNIYYFYIGLKKDCEEYLKQIVEVQPKNEGERWLKLINLSNIFLAANKTPYSFFQENLYKVFLEAAEMFVHDISEKRISFFSSFPKLVALCWIQYIIRDSYDFDFFKRALEDTAIILDDIAIDEKVKLYSLFFLGTLGLRLNVYEPFNFLLEKYRERLPEDIIIGIDCEIANSETKQPTLLKSTKWLKRKIGKMHTQLKKQISQVPLIDDK